MNPAWRETLVRQGAVLADGQVLNFGDAPAERVAAAQSNILVDLSHLAIWRASGPEAMTFLQSQLSSDVREISESFSQLSAYCNPKGRMLAIFRVFRRGDAYCLMLPEPLAETTFKRLRMFVLRAQVKLDPVDADIQPIGVSGPDAQRAIEECTGITAPEAVDAVVHHESLSILRVPGPHPRFILLAPTDRVLQLWAQLSGRLKPAGAGPWAWLDIQAGLPTVLPETVEEFVPQMANVELLGGVSFKKGCYPGQEIVARMHYLGRLKQRLYRARLQADVTPRPGDPVYAPDFGNQACGTVVNSQLAPGDGHDLLAVIQISSAGIGDLHLGSLQGPRLTLQLLPYPLPVDTGKNPPAKT